MIVQYLSLSRSSTFGKMLRLSSLNNLTGARSKPGEAHDEHGSKPRAIVANTRSIDRRGSMTKGDHQDKSRHVGWERHAVGARKTDTSSAIEGGTRWMRE